ncbi:trypsin-like serine protease [Streptomyces chrestomyceticus]|uniref:trypsin-like serine protease n=1 Tax=Streptomyces chrestomyceticus TaxID=68185 RepID=UPI003788502D
MSRIRPRAAAALLTSCTALSALSAVPAHAVAGESAKDGTYSYTAQVMIGEHARGCSGVLVDPQWVLTASNCFTEKPGEVLTPGKPRLKTTVTVGRTDLTSTQGTVSGVSELVPHPSRGVVLARLERPAVGVDSLPVADSPAAEGAMLTAAGFGRTKDEWAPLQLHTTALATGKVGDDALTLASTGSGGICKGDAGGPVVREDENGSELVALASGSNSAGCFGSDVAGPGQASAIRVDGLSSWLRSHFKSSLLMPGQRLNPGEKLEGRRVELRMQKDGNLAIYHKAGGQVLWATQSFGNPGAYLQMQSDGNLVVYKKTGGQGKGGNLWASDTFRSPGSYLHLQDDGNMVVYKKDGGQGKGGSLWSSDTFGRPVTFTSGLELRPGQWIENENTTLLMQRDGDLVLQHRESGVTLWASGTSGVGNYARMQDDGNFVVYKANGGQGKGGDLWSTKTSKNPGAFLHLQDDGNLVVYKKNSVPGKGGSLWDTATWGRPNTFAGGQDLRAGQWMSSKAGLLIMRYDGNLALYRRDDSTLLWASGTSGIGNYAHMQEDGNFVVYKANGGQGKGGDLWSTKTSKNPEAFLRLEDDGKLVVYKAGGGQGEGILWKAG